MWSRELRAGATGGPLVATFPLDVLLLLLTDCTDEAIDWDSLAELSPPPDDALTALVAAADNEVEADSGSGMRGSLVRRVTGGDSGGGGGGGGTAGGW